MQVPRLTFEEFLVHPDREELQHLAFLQEGFTVDCRKWTHGQVKDAQETLSTDYTYKDILDLVKIAMPNADAAPYHIVLATFDAIRQSIEDISLLEAETLAGTPTPKEIDVLDEMGGFDHFFKFPETDALCGGDITKYETVRGLSWELCYVKALYNKAINDYTKAVQKC
jgi:hypothetical protein